MPTTRYESCLSCGHNDDGLCLLSGRRAAAQAADWPCPADLYDASLPPGVPAALTVSSAVAGAIGLARAYAGVGRPADATIAARERLCGGCAANAGGRCVVCHCDAWAKVRVADQACPWGKWGPERDASAAAAVAGGAP